MYNQQVLSFSIKEGEDDKSKTAAASHQQSNPRNSFLFPRTRPAKIFCSASVEENISLATFTFIHSWYGLSPSVLGCKEGESLLLRIITGYFVDKMRECLSALVCWCHRKSSELGVKLVGERKDKLQWLSLLPMQWQWMGLDPCWKQIILSDSLQGKLKVLVWLSGHNSNCWDIPLYLESGSLSVKLHLLLNSLS